MSSVPINLLSAMGFGILYVLNYLNPVGALQISEKLGIPPENIVYLGDTGIDMQTAKNAGMYGVRALWGFSTRVNLVGIYNLNKNCRGKKL
jgi:hypothetical protein